LKENLQGHVKQKKPQKEKLKREIIDKMVLHL
jgi:hypothetical protein